MRASVTPKRASTSRERRPDYQRGLRSGFRPRRLQTLEGEFEVEIPQIREAAEPSVSKLFPCSTKVLRIEPLPGPGPVPWGRTAWARSPARTT